MNIPIPKNETVKAIFNWSKRNSTKLLSFGAIVSIFGTCYAAWKARPYADAALKEAELKKGSPLTTKEKLKIAAKYYVPAAGIAIGGSVCALTAEIKNGKRAEAMAGAYGILTTGYQALKTGVDKKYGEGEAAKIQLEELGVDDKVIRHGDSWGSQDCLGSYDKEEVLIIDDYSRRKFHIPLGRVLGAEVAMMSEFNQGQVTLKQWYTFLGVYDSFSEASKQIIEELGWTYDGQIELNTEPGWYPCRYEETTYEGERAFIMWFHTPPYSLYYDIDLDLFKNYEAKEHLD